MTCTTRRPWRLRGMAPLLLLLVAVSALGCGDLLEADDPTAVLEEELNNADGAELLRRNVLWSLYAATAPSGWESGLFADEFLYQASVFEEQSGRTNPNELLDRRDNVAFYEQFNSRSWYGQWQELWGRRTAVALEKLAAYAPLGARDAQRGEMFAVRGYAALQLAEHFCPGFPLHRVENYQFIYGPPRSTDEALEQALAAFDSAVSLAADSARILNFARVGRGRTLLNLGRYAEAAAAVADVPTPYAYQTRYSAAAGLTNTALARTLSGWGTSVSVAEREGGTGLNFASAKDPRVPTDSVRPSRNGAIILYRLAKYPTDVTPIVLAGGVEARLIEAEAALAANELGPWLTKLNELRRTVGLADTTDPGTPTARVDLTFRERAFWLFGTGSRLGDLRRLVRRYGRQVESVFPSGAHWRGGTYSTGTNLPFWKDEVTYSPGVTGCTSW